MSLPVWEEWIEIPPWSGSLRPHASLPVWEEWIEIEATADNVLKIDRLFPYGKSGLKYRAGVGVIPARRCLFPYGKSGLKWMNYSLKYENDMSLPVWEEWIEIATSSRSRKRLCVSSRMGRVD